MVPSTGGVLPHFGNLLTVSETSFPLPHCALAVLEMFLMCVHEQLGTAQHTHGVRATVTVGSLLSKSDVSQVLRQTPSLTLRLLTRPCSSHPSLMVLLFNACIRDWAILIFISYVKPGSLTALAN